MPDPLSPTSMSLFVFLCVLVSALAHAIWNALLKSTRTPWDNAGTLSYTAAILSLIALPFFQAPAPESWIYLLATGSVQGIYMWLVAKVYSHGDYAVGYPLMRGLSPLMTAACGFLFLHEVLSPHEIIGLFGISCGVLIVAFSAVKDTHLLRKQMGLALLCAIIIAYCAIFDGSGVRVSGSAIGYTLWVFVLQGVNVFVFRLIRREPVMLSLAQWRPWVGASCMVAGYAVALWAMTLAPIAMVAALRESSILFSSLVAFIILKEHPNRLRIMGVLVLAAGVIAFRLQF